MVELKDKQLKQVSGDLLPVAPGLLDINQINNMLKECGDFAYDRKYKSDFWLYINSAQRSALNQTKLNYIEGALTELKERGISENGLDQVDYDDILYKLNRCK